MGEPCECEQEAANSVATAGCMNGTVKRAEPMVVDADVDRMALLGGEPVERASGVDEGDGMEREPQTRLQQTKLLCGEIVQRSGNTTENIPIANGLPLEGEWLVYASGETTNSNGDADASSTATECVNSPSESRETEDAMENESRGCEGGTSEGMSADGAVGDAGHGVEPAEMSNVLETLITLSIKSEDLRSSGILHIRLGDMSCHAGDANRPGNRTDRLEGQADGSRDLTDVLRGQTDALNGLNNAEPAVVSHSDGARTYLATGDAKCGIDVTDGIESHADVSIGCRDAPSIETNLTKPVNEMEIIRTRRKMSETQNSPVAHETRPPEPTIHWRKVSVEDIDVYVPWNAPIEALGRTLVFGQVESAGGWMTTDFEGEGAGDGDDD